MVCAYWAFSKSPKDSLCSSCITQVCYCMNRAFLLAELPYFHFNFSSEVKPVCFFADPEPAGGWKQIPGIQGCLWNNISDRIWPRGRVWLATFPIQIMDGRAFPNSFLCPQQVLPHSSHFWGSKGRIMELLRLGKTSQIRSPTVHVCSAGTWWG